MMFVPVRTTAPLMQSILPSATAAVFIVTDVSASIFPLKIVDPPMVAELPICQKMLLAFAPPLRMMLPPAPPTVVRAEAI